MAHVADPILIGPANETDAVLRWAEKMPGVTYKTRVVKHVPTAKEIASLRDGDSMPALYELEAYDPDFNGYVHDVSHTAEGLPKHCGTSSNDWADPFLWDAYKHGDPLEGKHVTDEREPKIGYQEQDILDQRTTYSRDVDYTRRKPYESLKSGVWVEAAVNEDDIKELHPDPSRDAQAFTDGLRFKGDKRTFEREPWSADLKALQEAVAKLAELVQKL